MLNQHIKDVHILNSAHQIRYTQLICTKRVGIRQIMAMEFHPVILAGGRGSRMFPLCEECPKALLPVGNKPLIWYPVQLLEKYGFEEAVVVVRESAARAVSEVLDRFHSSGGVRMRFSVAEIPDQEDWGTADSLRAIKTRVKSDVLLISCDLVTTVPLHLLADFHRSHSSTLTALFVRPTLHAEEQRRKTTSTTERDIIGLTESSRLVYFAAQADLEDCLTVSRAMLKRHPRIRIYSQLMDAHLYLLRRWVLDYLTENKGISTVKGELVPHLVRHQSLKAPPTSHTVTLGKEGGGEEGRTNTTVNRQALQNAATSCVDDLEQVAFQMSSFAGYHGNTETFTNQLIRCHALVLEQELCVRVNTIPAYMEINRMLPHHLSEFQLERTESLSSLPAKGKGVSSDCLIGGGVQLSDKASVKRSCVGQHCCIGDKTKIISSILMDHVQVGEGCTLQGCILCSHVRIEDRVTLKDCFVGANFTVTKEADIRGETLVVEGGLHF